MITEQGIKAALRSAPAAGKKTIELKDDGQRGEGRLVLIIRVSPRGLTPEWYAVWYRDEKRSTTKIGTYPTMALVDARKAFRTDYAPAISRGESPAGPRARKLRQPGDTFEDLCRGYVNSLAGRPSFTAAHCYLLGPVAKPGKPAPKKLHDAAIDHVGAAKRAADVTTSNIMAYLRDIHDRGALSAAEIARPYLHAAFKWAIKGANSYHTDGAADWGLTVNPVMNIGRNASQERG